MRVEHRAIADALEKINDLKFRAELGALAGNCPSCGASRMRIALRGIFEPVEGNQCRCTEKISKAIRPSQNPGMDSPRMDTSMKR